MKRIAITSIANNFYGCGARQNTIILYDILTEIGYEVFFIYSDTLERGELLSSGFNNYVFKHVNDDFGKVDLLICSDFTCPDLVHKIKQNNKNCKVSLLILGSLYYSDLSAMLSNKNQHLLTSQTWIDEVWISPHIKADINYHQSIFYPAKVCILPFIWSEKFLENSLLKHKDNGFLPSRWKASDKKAIIMEPNLTVQKFFLNPIILCDIAYRSYRCVESVSVMCADHFKENKTVLNRVQNLMLFKSSSASVYFNPRVDLIQALYDCGNIVVSNQHSCDLNYLYLECLYLNIPLIHNSSLLKEAGYYYPDNDLNMGAEKLYEATKYHDENRLFYQSRANKIIQTFHVSNTENIAQYKSIIESLLNRNGVGYSA